MSMEKLKSFKQYQTEAKADYITISQLKPFYLYRIHARNSRFGIYTPSDSGFLIRRLKFHEYFAFVEYHWDTGAPYGTVRPLKELEKTPFAEEDIKQGPSEIDGVKYYGYHKEEELMNYLKTKMKEYEDE